MAFGFPAYHTENYSAGNGEHDIEARVRKTLERLSWKIKREEPNLIVASTSMGLRSWGERLHIRFHPDNSLTLRSECALPTQCLDWGKNKANVNKFIAALEEGSEGSKDKDAEQGR